MGVLSLVNGDYKPTNITGGYHLVGLPTFLPRILGQTCGGWYQSYAGFGWDMVSMALSGTDKHWSYLPYIRPI